MGHGERGGVVNARCFFCAHEYRTIRSLFVLVFGWMIVVQGSVMNGQGGEPRALGSNSEDVGDK